MRASGTIKAVRPGMLQIVTSDGGQWQIGVAAKPQDLNFTGVADASWLRPGMFVQFTGQFNRRGQAQAPIKELLVFTPREGFKVGIFPATNLGEAVEAPSGDAKPAKPVVRSLQVAGRLASVKKGSLRNVRGAAPPSTDPSVPVGVLGSGKQDREAVSGTFLRVVAGAAAVSGQLADDAKVSFDVADYSCARPGDKVEVDAWYYRAQKGQGIAYATKLAIAAAEPLTRAGQAADKAAKDEKTDFEKVTAGLFSSPRKP